MNAIVTGSRVYGEPTKDSDIDLVVLVSHQDLNQLVCQADGDGPKDKDGNYDGIGSMSASLRFGKLNLIVTTDPLAFEVWRRGTAALKSSDLTPSRSDAVAFFKALREHCGLFNKEPDLDTVIRHERNK